MMKSEESYTRKRSRMFSRETVKVSKDDSSRDTFITITTTRHKYWLFGPQVSSTVTYRGDCTVWHNAETGMRASTTRECYLCDLWKQLEWQREAVEKQFDDMMGDFL